MAEPAKVENQIFYHIQRGEVPKGGYNWIIGRKTFWGKEKNFVANSFESKEFLFQDPRTRLNYNYNFLADEMISYINTGKKNPIFASNFHYNPIIAFQELESIVYHYTYACRELILEDIRKELFPDYPSRLTGLWVIPDDLEELKYWWNALGLEKKNTIIKLNLSGKVFEGSNEYISAGMQSVNRFRKQALKYWRGNPGTMPGTRFECLFEGYATVLDIIEPKKMDLNLNM
jgi:hypothetical protein